MRLLVTDPALQALRQATAWLIMTLGKQMNKYAISFLVFVALAFDLEAVEPDKKDDRPWPKTVEEALDVIDHDMPDRAKRQLATIRPSCLIMMHMGWGMGLRNALPIWGNAALIKDAGDIHPDDVSGVIIERYRNRLFSRLPKDYQERVREFDQLLEKTMPSVSKEMFMSDVVKEWTKILQKRHDELGEFKQRPFEMRINGRFASIKVPPDLFWQTSIAEFLDKEGRKMGSIYYDGDVLWIDSGEALPPNQSLEPTPTTGMPPAEQESRQP